MAVDAVRARLALAVRTNLDVPRPLGEVVLHPHQREAAALLLARCRQFGGALLADPVGAGKTYTALACAARYAAAVVVAPAVLRDTWRAAFARTGTSATFRSMESLSRAAAPSAAPGALIIVDEAHHARNPTTRRYRTLASLAWGHHVLLLSATPIHNTARDLSAMVHLFAHPDDDVLRSVVVRRTLPPAIGTPTRAPLRWLPNPARRALLEQILDLPPPLPADDAGHAHALGILGLVRQWLSSEAALRAALHARRTAAQAMISLVERGERPTAAAMARAIVGPGTLQLSLGLDGGVMARPAEWHAQLERWTTAINRLTHSAQLGRDSDVARANTVRIALERHATTPAVAFTSCAATARAMFHRWKACRRAAGLWGAGAYVASGRMSRRDVLARLGPGPASRPNDPMHLDLLVATDVLSEGVDLQGAGVLVHLDLPWTPARIEQRVGRLQRPGSPHTEVASYAFRLPPAGERALRLLRRLCDKARASHLAAGIALDALRATPTAASAPGAVERLCDLVRAWPVHDESGVSVAMARARVRGARDSWVAAIRHGHTTYLVASTNRGVSRDTEHVASLLALTAGATFTPVDDRLAARFEARVRRWCRTRAVLDAAHARTTDVQRRAVRKIRALGGRATRTARASALELVAHAVSLVHRATSAGGEVALASWLEGRPCSIDDVRALVAALAPRTPGGTADEVPTPWAILLIGGA